MAEVKILVKGYISAESNGSFCSTITLIQDKDINMVVDPGTLKDRQILIDVLKKENLDLEDINFVCITHSHMDHYRNIGMFPNAKALDYYGVWDKDKVHDWNQKFSENIEIIKTPGHNYDCITLLVNTEKGIIAVVGDVFWKENFPEYDEYASDIETLKKSRALVLKKADFIIPGHGDIYEAAQK
ncbi:MBL fold metallo-hydrolase [Candidatus Woesearchaeota archaeon]|nr:MBL fold metallo-hydrolase [Candidatus Woesearchaeota archaeon]